MYRVGDFLFDPRSGELRPSGDSGGAPVERLPPQPARLLELLVERDGGILTREEVRSELWADVSVDLDQSLAFCVRQVRSALGDSARSPVYVETLPRRGYRLLVPARPVDEGLPPVASSDPAGRSRIRSAAPTPGRSHRRRGPAVYALVGALGVLVAVLVLAWWGSAPSATVAVRLRVAVLPFPDASPDASTDPGAPADLSSVADSLLVGLARAGGDRLEVVGPTTTSSFASDPDALRRMAAELELDYLVNGRIIAEPGTAPRLLVELIRLPDGAHVWVESFDDPTAAEAIVSESLAGLLEALGGSGTGGPVADSG